MTKPQLMHELKELRQRVADLQSSEADFKQVERALRDSEESFRDLYENAPTAYFSISAVDGSILRCNSAALQLLGYERKTLMRMKALDLYAGTPHGISKAKEIFKRFVIGESIRDVELQMKTKDGQPLWVSLSVEPLKDPDGNVTRSRSMVIDISDRKQAQEALRNARDELEQRVQERTAELATANKQLKLEIEERKRAEEHIFALSQQLMKAQEIERQRLSCDLHDNLAQDLSTIKIGLDTLFDDQPDGSAEKRQRVSVLSEMTKKTIMDVRNLSYDLRPGDLDQLGLVQTVRRYCEEFSARNGLEVEFLSVGMDDTNLDFDTEIALYRLMQEGLTNIQRHADASKVTIRLVTSFPNIILRIQDNGKGFPVKRRLHEALEEKRMGLRSMQQRVALLNGKIEIKSHHGKGTKIVVEVPYKEKNSA
jgi:PAS domain S-box-containing protein